METSASAWNQPTPVLLKTVLVIGAGLMILQGLVHLAQALRGGSNVDLPAHFGLTDTRAAAR